MVETIGSFPTIMIMRYLCLSGYHDAKAFHYGDTNTFGKCISTQKYRYSEVSKILLRYFCIGVLPPEGHYQASAQLCLCCCFSPLYITSPFLCCIALPSGAYELHVRLGCAPFAIWLTRMKCAYGAVTHCLWTSEVHEWWVTGPYHIPANMRSDHMSLGAPYVCKESGTTTKH